MADLRSNYPTTIDDLKTLPYYQDMSIDDKRILSRYNVLVEKNNLTFDEQQELTSLINSLKDKMINSEDWNKVVGAIINLETYFKDNVIDEIDGKLSGLDEIATNAVNTVNTVKNQAINEMNTAKTQTIYSVNQLKTSATNEINNTKDSTISEISIIRNDAVQSVNTSLSQANDVFAEMSRVEDEFKENLPVFNDAIEKINTAQPLIKELQDASNAVQEDIATIKATGNTEIIIQGSDWKLNGDIYEKEITHNLYSENLHITAKDLTTKSACTIGWQILDKTRILLKSDLNISMSIVVSSSFYKPLITSEVDEGEIIRSRQGLSSLDSNMARKINYENFTGTTIN